MKHKHETEDGQSVLKEEKKYDPVQKKMQEKKEMNTQEMLGGEDVGAEEKNGQQ